MGVKRKKEKKAKRGSTPPKIPNKSDENILVRICVIL
jgi:hypothetical protein